MVMPQSTLESLLFFLVLSLLASYLVKIKYGSNIKVQKKWNYLFVNSIGMKSL